MKNITYSILNGYIVLSVLRKTIPINLPLIIFCFLTSGLFAQETITVTGSVYDSQGVLLPGVSIVQKGTTNGVTTDFDGQYSINAPSNASLLYTYIGMATQEISLNGRRVVNVDLQESTESLDEVVVIGYGTQSRRKVTSAVSSVGSDELQDQPVSSIDNLIQGRAAGVQVSQNTGAPGGGISLKIRGNTSIGGGNEPLYVIDGLPIKSGDFGGLADQSQSGSASTLNALGDINPNDIESIEILKDAAATSIYGSRGSNGVVLISTRKGKEGKPRINVDYQYSFQKLIRKIPVTNSRETRELGYEAWTNAGRVDAFEHFTDSLNSNYNNDTDWQEELFKTAPIFNANISASGGTKNLSYATTLGYYDQEGIIPNTGYKRITSRLNFEYNNPNEKFSFGSNLAYTRSKNDRANDGLAESGGGGGTFRGILNNLFEFQSPFLSPYDENGNLTVGFNPIGVAYAITNEAYTNRVLGNIYGKYDILEGLSLKSSLGLDYLGLRENRFFPSTVFASATDFRQSTARHLEDITWVNENTLSYNTILGNKSSMSALIGFSQQETETQTILAQRTNAASDNIITVNAGATLTDANSFITNWGLNSYFGRLNYDYDGKYLMQFTVRRDGSSRFGKSKQYGTFPSGSVGWRMSDEMFMKDVNFVNDFKIRASLGKTGNQEIPNFVAQGLLVTGADYNGQAGTAPASNGLPNDKLTWEETTQFDTGLDLTMFNNRLSIILDYYEKKTEGLLFNIPVPTTTGYTQLTTNLGSLENKGFDIGISSTNLTGSLEWSSSLNLSINRNKVLELPDGNDISVGQHGVTSIIREGEPLGIFYGYNYNGVYATSEDVPVGLTSRGIAFQAGDAIFEDITGDNVIDEQDRTIIGNANPDFTGGFNNSFSYKGFDLDILFTFSYGNDVLNLFRAKRDDGARAFPVPDPEALTRWQEEGDITNYPRWIQGDPIRNGRRESTRWLEDGSFLRMKNLTLGYNFPKMLLNQFHLERLRLYASFQNFITFTNYSGYDPETISSSIFNTGVFGVDIGTFPPSKTVTIGLKIGL